MAAVIIDSGPLVALLDRGEQYHEWAVEQIRHISPPLATCDAVLAETCFLLSRRQAPMKTLAQYLRRRWIVSEFASGPRLDQIFALMASYANVPMSFADACLVCLVEDHPDAVLFTLDRDFTIYRQQRRRLIPLVAPF